jgi:hypothetical protein
MTAAISESDMGEGQVPRKGERDFLPFVFSTASNDVREFGRVPASVGIVGRKAEYVG